MAESTELKEHLVDLWNEELERSQEILNGFLENLSKEDREELSTLLKIITQSDVTY